MALRLGLAMLLLQFSIGAANDYADAGADTIAKPWKPIPAGLVGRRSVALTCAIAGTAGLIVAATLPWWAFIVAAAGLADGLAYDLRLKTTPVAWVPFAAGVGLLPLFAWLGAHGSAPVAFLGVVAMGVLAGAALALANAYGDIDRDRRSGVRSIAVVLGPRRTLGVNALLLGSAEIVAVATTIAGDGPPEVVAVEMVGCGLTWLGMALAGARPQRLRPLVWEIQAVGLAVLGLGWLAALNTMGVLRS
jgi:4-hydroxybenzoate polyprenyltransferase